MAKNIREATPNDILKAIKRFGLLAVKGKKTNAPALIYAKPHMTRSGKKSAGFDASRHVKIKVAELIKAAHAKGEVVVTDGKYVKIWTSGFFISQGGKTSVKKHTRKAMTMEQMKKKASSIGLKKWTKKNTKAKLAASLRRHAKSPKKVHSKKGHKKGHSKKGKFASLKKEEEESAEE